MKKKIEVIKKDEDLNNSIDANIIFKVIQRDTIGKSGANPTWGAVYENSDNIQYKGIGLYKDYDYDSPDASFSEKVWSILGKNILTQARIPEIDIVEESKGYPGIISYRLLDNDKEDLIHMRDVLFHKFEREDIKNKKDIFQIEDILECIKIQVRDPKNYKEIEKSVIQTLLLDSITNNSDRHPNNWALIVDKATKHYDLAAYDHSSAFVDMFRDGKRFTVDGWVSTYLITNENQRKKGVGELGNQVIKYISENYKEHFDDFCIKFNKNLDTSLEEISQYGLNIDMQRLRRKMHERSTFLNSISKEKGEMMYED